MVVCWCTALEVVHLVARWGAVLDLPVGIELPFDQSFGFTVGDRLVWLLELN